MSGSSVLDENALVRLREWGGDELLGQLVVIFLANAPVRMTQIRSGASGADISEAERGAHSLKSSAANLGAVRVREMASEMERAAVEGDLNRVRELLPSLEAAFVDAIAALKTVKDGIEE
ncbi:MAG TPA: Hpt domain-containing protein [Longimicrobiales bacterium]|nr:Hpt domain-containing protein [Longimicrobiales bacterium]